MYNSVHELPPELKKLPYHAKVLYMDSFNDNVGGNANLNAWRAVRTYYKQLNNGRWVAKYDDEFSSTSEEDDVDTA
ncbi:ChaB [Epinotia aporema granulovirus]|uniref:ChaB n=1 Tax=Epinotia aporema granulovirus TaxID=166056 RepID=K4EQT9_9BBAC|nr:ChaB [Epinotia aporema granulovirus]AER41516.1 ChaB [Epinotia aporema granulovirus]